MDVVAEPGHEAALFAPFAHGPQSEGIPVRLARRQWPVVGGEHVVQEATAVLGDSEEPGAAAEQPRGERTLTESGADR